jgi:hypothetical protein
MDYSARIGTAVQSGGHVCFSINNAKLSPKSVVSLVTPSNPQSVAEAEIIGHSATGCPGIRNETPPQSGYELKLVQGTIQDFMPVIAVSGGADQFTSAASTVTAHLGTDAANASFRSCTSSDGVHLTVWRAKPLQSTRLWHQYYYMGQDLEPTCTEKDTR